MFAINVRLADDKSSSMTRDKCFAMKYILLTIYLLLSNYEKDASFTSPSY